MANIALAGGFLVLAGCSNHIVPIASVHDQPLPVVAQTLTPDELTRRVTAGATQMGWEIAPLGPNLLRATYIKQTHVVTVRISYSPTTFSVDFVSSINMEEDNGKIHHKYGEWLQALSAGISGAVGRTS
jgi:hypothetical protein